MIENFTDSLQDWADQYLHELTKQSSWRSDMLQGLIAAQDYQACREFIDEWEQDDKHPNSLAQKYDRVASHLWRVRATVSDETKYVCAEILFPGCCPVEAPVLTFRDLADASNVVDPEVTGLTVSTEYRDYLHETDD